MLAKTSLRRTHSTIIGALIALIQSYGPDKFCSHTPGFSGPTLYLSKQNRDLKYRVAMRYVAMPNTEIPQFGELQLNFHHDALPQAHSKHIITNLL
jgi:hypothetical protein